VERAPPELEIIDPEFPTIGIVKNDKKENDNIPK
jgi:hypothetical protein